MFYEHWYNASVSITCSCKWGWTHCDCNIIAYKFHRAPPTDIFLIVTLNEITLCNMEGLQILQNPEKVNDNSAGFSSVPASIWLQGDIQIMSV